MHGALDPDHVPLHLILHIILEGHLPRRQTRGFMVEDEAIFLLPNDPNTNHEDLHKEGWVKASLAM
jgi:hypothetical protein